MQKFRKAFPEEAAFVNETQSLPIKHLFAISNLGQSPFDVQAIVAIPVKYSDVGVVMIESVEASKNNEASISCSVTNAMEAEINFNTVTVGENGTEMVACGVDGVDCVVYSCAVGRVGVAGHVVTVTVKLRVESAISGKKNRIFEIKKNAKIFFQKYFPITLTQLLLGHLYT